MVSIDLVDKGTGNLYCNITNREPTRWFNDPIEVHTQTTYIQEDQGTRNIYYEISREKLEPEPRFEPRTSGFPGSGSSFSLEIS